MKRKVKITKLPNLKDGGYHTGDQMNYGLYRGGGNLKEYITGTEESSDENIRVYYPEDKENANVEVEKGELIKDSQGIYKVGGKKHADGGHKTNVEPGAYVFSDYITMHPALQMAFGFEASSKKKKDNTIAALLNKKVDVKDYNRNTEILRKAELGEPVDQYALNTAMNRLPDYNKYISRAALAGELSKAMMGKDYEIPQLGIPALEELQKDSRIESAAQEPMSEMKYGGMQKMQVGGGPKKIKKSELSTFLQQNPGYVQDPNNPNRYVKAGTAGSKDTRTVVIKGAPGSMEVTRAIPGGKAGADWEKWIISQLQKGVTIDQLAEAKHGTKEGLKKYEKYYVPIPGKDEQKKVEVDIPGTPPEEILIEDVPGTTITTTIAPTTTTTKKTPPRLVTITPPTTRTRPFKQDVLNLASALGEYTTDVYPVRQALPAVSIDPAFLQPDYAPIQSVAAQQSREASLYARAPQTQSAVLADIQSRTLPELARLQAVTGAQNVQTDMAARQFNAQMYGQNIAANAGLARQYLEDVARFVDSSDKQRITKGRNVKNAANQLLFNVDQASMYNQMFPQAAIDPWTASMYQPYGSGMSAASVFNSQSSASGNNAAIMDAIEKEVEKIPDEKARDTYRKALINQYFQAPRTSSRTAMNPAMLGMMGGMGAGYMNPVLQMAMLQQQQAMNPSLFSNDED